MNGAAITTGTSTLFLPINYPQPLLQKRAPNSFHLLTTRTCSCNVPPIRALSLEEIPPNALRRKRDTSLGAGFSLGVDLGLSRTGLVLSKGFSIRPLTVTIPTTLLCAFWNCEGKSLSFGYLKLLINRFVVLEVDEFIIGLPKSSDGKETPQSNKVRSVAGRFAVRAAERGWRVYLQDEHGTSAEAMGQMIDLGLSKSARQGKIDAYAAVVVLERYFSLSGQGIELVLPKQLELQEKLLKGPPEDEDFYPEGFDD
ncbi:hypothetical protein RJ640_015164 [Escallonia rubra]|uniref:YqgF/RNase H-like domain-containing protein n=1 Tax=Escallonia rubra TaxID=112253 RepID=A0AA88UPR0_9ASTE|nr:hypothetical protein RJ640_015164 [Escallonia rubra]